MNQTPDIQGIQGIGTPETRIYVAQGEHAIAQGPGVVISTLLGSCVAVCLWDPILQLGGMNHFLLPEEGETLAGMSGYGVHGGMPSSVLPRPDARTMNRTSRLDTAPLLISVRVTPSSW